MKSKIMQRVLCMKKYIIPLILYLYMRVFTPIIRFYLSMLEKCFDKNYNLIEVNSIIDCIKLLWNNKISMLIWLINALILILIINNIIITKRNIKIENEGINFSSKDGTHGTANFDNPEDIDILSIGNEEKTPGIILGKTEDDKTIVLPDSYTKVNRNVMIFGASGSGKSTSFIIPNILKFCEQEEKLEEYMTQGKNIVCTDPKGELYCKTSNALKESGYEVKIFNLVNPKHSDGIDIMKFIEKEVDAQVFAQVVTSTSQNAGKKGEEFWQNTQENLLKALLLHIAFEVEDKNKKNMRYLNSILASGDIKTIDAIFKNSKEPAKIAYNIYTQASEQIKQSTIVGLATKLQIFQLDEIAAITERNDIDFNELNDKKMAIFCVTSDMDTTMSFLNSLFFSFLFIKVIRIADNSPERKLKRDLVNFLDEFPNIGQIPDFQQKLSTMRSRGIWTIIVCQHIAGLKLLYPDDGWQGLIGNCDLKIMMGTNDLLTADYISKMLGVSTVTTSNIRKNAGFDGMLEYGTEGTSVVKRNLANADEIMRTSEEEQYIVVRGKKAFKCKKLRYWDYRLANKVKETTIEQYVPKIVKTIIQEEKVIDELPTFEIFLRGRRS